MISFSLSLSHTRFLSVENCCALQSSALTKLEGSAIFYSCILSTQENKVVNPASDPGALQWMVKEEELSSAIKTPAGAGIVVNTIANVSSSPAQTILGVLAKINQIGKKVADVRHPSFYEDQLLMFAGSSLCKGCMDCFECSTQCTNKHIGLLWSWRALKWSVCILLFSLFMLFSYQVQSGG